MIKTGEVVYEVGPYWKVVHTGNGQYIVVDTSVTPAQRVSEPSTRAEAELSAQTTANLWRAVRSGGLGE